MGEPEPLLAQVVVIQPRESCQVPQPSLPVPSACFWVWSIPARVLTQSPALGWATDLGTDVPVIAGILRLPSPSFFCSSLKQGTALKEVLVNAPFSCVPLFFPSREVMMGFIWEARKWPTGLQEDEKFKCWVGAGGLSLGVNL